MRERGSNNNLSSSSPRKTGNFSAIAGNPNFRAPPRGIIKREQTITFEFEYLRLEGVKRPASFKEPTSSRDSLSREFRETRRVSLVECGGAAVGTAVRVDRTTVQNAHLRLEYVCVPVRERKKRDAVVREYCVFLSLAKDGGDFSKPFLSH